jgi:peptidylprolyl isomerase
MVIAQVWEKFLAQNLGTKVIIAGGCSSPAYFAYAKYKKNKLIVEHRAMIKDKVWFDIAIGSRYAGRVLIGLYSERLPLTCENFAMLCKGHQVGDRTLGYKNTRIFRVIPGIGLVGGDVLTDTGSSGCSIYGGGTFPDENFSAEFVQDGDLAMMNNGPNTNDSRFLITLRPCEAFYGKHVVFGTVLKGMKVIRECGDKGDRSGEPTEEMRILDCGLFREGEELPVDPSFTASLSPPMTELDFERGRGGGGADADLTKG